MTAFRGDLRYEEAGLRELRQDGLHLSLAVVVVGAVLIFLASGVYIAYVGETPAYVALALVAVSVGVNRLAAWSVRLASAALVAGLVGAIALAIALFPSTPVILATLVVPVLVATVLLDTFGGLAAALGASGVIVATALRQPGSIPTEVPEITLGLCWLVLALTAVLWRSFHTVLYWSWASYAEAERRTAELRERQVELGRLNLSLNHAYERLEQAAAEIERAREVAETARRLKAEFAASVSHELRTPLNLVIGLSELMVVSPHAGAPELPEVYRADVEAIYRNACHISNLIDDVLDLSQIEAHRMGLLREWTSLRDVVAQATATVKTLFENTGLSLDVRLPDDLPPVFVDPVRIRQILINLLNNAVRFTEEGGVAIEARAEADQVVIDVADTGVGMPPEDLAWVFLEFWHAGEPMRGRRGSGLGLAVSKRFAELHGGNMWATSSRGRGSTFSLALPLGEKAVVQEAELAAPRWQRIEQQAPASPTVLLVDPEPETLRVFRRYLDGYQVVVAPDTPSVARLAGEPSIRAVIVGAPARRDAVQQALQHAAPAQPPARFPLITCALRTSKTIAQELGVLDYLVKPVSQQQLKRALRRFGRSPRDLVLVDDDPEMLHLLTRMVSALAPRCRVRTAPDGLRALDLLRERPPQGLLLDLLMPGLDGYGVLARMRQQPELAAVPVVAITARGAEDDGLVADALEISQVGGLRVGELTRWVRAGLDAPRAPDRPLDRAGAAPAPPAAPPASPASAGSR